MRRRPGAGAVLLVLFSLVLGGSLAAVQPVLAQDPVAKVSSPQPGATVREVVVITGTATHPQFSFYKVEYALEPSDHWIIIGDTQPMQVQDGVLVQWDTRMVPDGSYSLRLLVVDKTGNYIERVVRQVVVSNAGPTETPTPEETPTETPTATPTVDPGHTVEPTALPTVEIVVQRSPTATATRAAQAEDLPTAIPVDSGEVNPGSGLVDTLADMAGGILAEAIAAVGVDFGGLGQAFVRGATLAVGAFVAVGMLALVRQVLIVLYNLIRR